MYHIYGILCIQMTRLDSDERMSWGEVIFKIFADNALQTVSCLVHCSELQILPKQLQRVLQQKQNHPPTCEVSISANFAILPQTLSVKSIRGGRQCQPSQCASTSRIRGDEKEIGIRSAKRSWHCLLVHSRKVNLLLSETIFCINMFCITATS